MPWRQLVASGLMRSGALGLVRSLRPGRAIVLMYHRINDAADPFFPALPSAAFEQQVRFLKRCYAVEPLPDVMAWLAAGAVGRPRVALTIDDGYPDTYAVAWPILRRHQTPATLFLATAPPETREPLWLDALRAWVKTARAERLDAVELGLPELGLGSTAERLQALKLVIRRLKATSAETLREILVRIRERLAPAPGSPPCLTWAQVREMQRAGLDVGAHTHRHYILSRSTLDEAQSEIAHSIALIRSRLGVAACTFAYPNGQADDFDAAHQAMLRGLGIRWALSTVSGFAGPGDAPLAMPRVATKAPSLPLFACRLAGLGREAPAPPGRIGAAARPRTLADSMGLQG